MRKLIFTLSALALIGTVASAQTKSKAHTATKRNKAKIEKAKADLKDVAVVADKPVEMVAPPVRPTPPPPPPPPAAAPAPPQEQYDFDKYAKLDKLEHDFGQNVKQVAEGVNATFTITNTSKEPLIIERVQASCGCTVPTWDKEPIAPGKTGSFTANYHSQGRPGMINKTLTIYTNRGTKAVSIKGNVEASPVVPPTPTPTPAPQGEVSPH